MMSQSIRRRILPRNLENAIKAIEAMIPESERHEP